MTKHAWIVALSGVMAVGFVACGGSSKREAAPPASEAPKAAAEQTKGEFGVPECDEYIAKYLECIDNKVPEAMRDGLKQSLKQTKSSWQQAASTSEGRAGLATACRQATETARQTMKAHGCVF
jgi:hypothetical protein